MTGTLKSNKSVVCLLLLICILSAMIFMMNNTSAVQFYKHFFSGPFNDNITSKRLEAGYLNLCPNTVLSARDIVSMAKYKTHCSIHHLTKVQKETSSYPGGVSRVMYIMANSPVASPCKCPRELKLAYLPILKTCLLSFPGSGNSWMRHLIEQLTGIYSGSVYITSEERFLGFPFEGVVNKVSVIKNHRPPERNGSHSRVFGNGMRLSVQFDQLLIIIRNPYFALMAEFKRYYLRLGKVGNTVIDTQSSKWITFFKDRSVNWGTFIKGAFDTSLPLFVIYYEDAQSCLLAELVKVAYFLSNKDMDEFSFCCTLNQQEGTFHRPSSNQTIEDVYSPEDRKSMNNILLETAIAIKNSYPDVAKRILGYVLP